MKRIAALFFFIAVSCRIYSQDGGSTKITVFQPGGVKADDTPKPSPRTNLVKWNYCILTRGVFLMNYEFALNNKFTAEAGAGLTYRDFIYEAVKGEVFNEYKNAKVNLAVEGSIRFYPKDHYDFEGIYLSPGISYRKYSFDNQKALYGNGYYPGYDNAFNPGYSFMDMQFRFGYQYESWWIDDVITDFYVGFAYRNATSKYYELSSANNSSSSTVITPVTKKDSYPQALLGFKLGIVF